MPKLLVEAKKNLSRTEKTLILVATSGDTGKAALDGYHDIPGVEIAVFYPTGGTSEIQRLQMATQEAQMSPFMPCAATRRRPDRREEGLR